MEDIKMVVLESFDFDNGELYKLLAFSAYQETDARSKTDHFWYNSPLQENSADWDISGRNLANSNRVISTWISRYSKEKSTSGHFPINRIQTRGAKWTHFKWFPSIMSMPRKGRSIGALIAKIKGKKLGATLENCENYGNFSAFSAYHENKTKN